MTHRAVPLAAFAIFVACTFVAPAAEPDTDGWYDLFDGKTLDGWKTAERPDSVRVEDGAIVTNGPRAHLFYVGPVGGGSFKDFELEVEALTRASSNSGIFIHTEYQERGWPRRGYEVQVNNSHPDTIRTGSLYGVVKIADPPSKDDAWFPLKVKVLGKRIRVWVSGERVVDYTEPADVSPTRDGFDRKLSRGTIAIQAHDPGSTVLYRKVRIRLLPPVDFPVVDYHTHLKGGLTLDEALANARRRGVKLGIAENCGVGFPVTDDAGIARFLERLEGKPVFRGMQAEGREWVRMFSPEAVARFDYVITDALTLTDDSGRRMRLWIDGEVKVDDPETFMDMYVDRIVRILEDEPIDIFANATVLPSILAPRHDALWTEARMDRVIAAAVKGGVAIEINARYKLPTLAFLARAKKAGAKFSFGTNNGDRDLGDLAYPFEAAEKLGLREGDMFAPRPDAEKPIRRCAATR